MRRAFVNQIHWAYNALPAREDARNNVHNSLFLGSEAFIVGIIKFLT